MKRPIVMFRPWWRRPFKGWNPWYWNTLDELKVEPGTHITLDGYYKPGDSGKRAIYCWENTSGSTNSGAIVDPEDLSLYYKSTVSVCYLDVNKENS